MHNVKILISNLNVRLPVYFCQHQGKFVHFHASIFLISRHFFHLPERVAFGNRLLCASSPFDACHLWVLSRIELSSWESLPLLTLSRRLILIATETSTRRPEGAGGLGLAASRHFLANAKITSKSVRGMWGTRRTDRRTDRQTGGQSVRQTLTERVKKLTDGDDGLGKWMKCLSAFAVYKLCA